MRLRSISLGDRGISMRVGFDWSRGSCRIRLWDEYGPHFQERREGRLARWNFAVVFLFFKTMGYGKGVPHGCGDEPRVIPRFNPLTKTPAQGPALGRVCSSCCSVIGMHAPCSDQ